MSGDELEQLLDENLHMRNQRKWILVAVGLTAGLFAWGLTRGHDAPKADAETVEPAKPKLAVPSVARSLPSPLVASQEPARPELEEQQPVVAQQEQAETDTPSGDNSAAADAAAAAPQATVPQAAARARPPPGLKNGYTSGAFPSTAATNFRATLTTVTLTTVRIRVLADTLRRFAVDGLGLRLRHTGTAASVLSAGGGGGNQRLGEDRLMADLVKWRGGQLNLAEKIDRWRRLQKQEALFVPDAPPLVTATETRLDLPRTCAVTRKPWAARYLREDAGFGYIRSVIPDGRIRLTLYRPDDVRKLPDLEAGIEDCPHCGAYTPDGYLGSVWCEACRSWVCFGLTSREGIFTCGCGHRGPLVASTQTAMGVVLR